MSKHPYEDEFQILRQQAKEKAQFCLATGIAPSEYDQLTQIEIAAFIDEFNKRAARNK